VIEVVLSHVGFDDPLGGYCIDRIEKMKGSRLQWLPDCAQTLLHGMNKDWHTSSIDQVLRIIPPGDVNSLVALESDGLIRVFTIICRVVWGREAGEVEGDTREALASVEGIARFPNRRAEDVHERVLQILEMELHLTRVAAGIVAGAQILTIFAELPRLAVTNYHRRLAVLTLNRELQYPAE
jgi:hypothetical protein